MVYCRNGGTQSINRYKKSPSIFLSSFEVVTILSKCILWLPKEFYRVCLFVNKFILFLVTEDREKLKAVSQGEAKVKKKKMKQSFFKS